METNEKITQPKSIFEQILLGVKVNNETLVGLAADMETIKEQQRLILLALYPPAPDEISEPTALGAETTE